MKNLLLSVSLLLGLSSFGNAQSLDTSFGVNGTVTHTNFGSWLEATELTDGNVILSGALSDGSKNQAVIMKMKPDGILDSSFGSGGKYVIDKFSDNDYYESFSKTSLLPDGKLLLLYGSEYDNEIDPATWTISAIRLNANGTTDNTFNGFSKDNLSLDDIPTSILSLSSGKILIYGSNYLTRFNADGTLDTSYGNNGTRTISFGIESLNMIGNALYLHDFSGGRLVKLDNEASSNTKVYNLSNYSHFYFSTNNIYIHDSSNSNSIIKKLDSNFEAVNNFGNNGTASFPDYLGRNFIIQPQGSILTQNYYYDVDNNGNPTNYVIEYHRINPSGSLDSTFGTAGVYKFSLPNNAPYKYYGEDYLHSNGKLYHLFYDKDNEVSNATMYFKRSNLPNEILATIDYAETKNIKIIQNPVKDNLAVNANLRNAKIYDAGGQETGITFDGHQTSVINLKPGVYIISATSDKGNKINLKFIKK